MNKLRRFLTIGVMAITVLATVGAYVPTSQASASAGDLIKMSGLSSVYYLGSDGKRYVFPNEATYMSWYNDFSGVVTITPSELQSYPLGGNVTMRAGTKLVKITTDPSVYAVEPNGVLRKIQSEAQAAALYGTNWSKRVVDVSDAFFTNYTIGSVLASGAVPAGSLVKNASVPATYYYDGSNYRLIADETAFNANRFSFANVLTITNTITAGGSNIASAELVNVAQNGATTGVVVTGSGLMVSLNSATPAAVSVPENGSRVNMVKVNLTAASDGAVTLNSLTVKRIGLSQASYIDKVWAEQNGVIVASKKSMNSNDESILTLSPALTINAGQTVTLDLLASFTTASGNIGLSIASASAVSATAASVTGSFPINGNLMSPTNYSVTNLSFATTSVSSTVKVGDEKAELAHFTVAFESDARDVNLQSITLKNNGVEDLSNATMNLFLEYAGNKVSSSYTIDGRYVTFYFPANYELLKDDSSKDFYIKGDIIAKENTGTPSFSLVLNKSTELSASEKTTGFGVNVVTTGGASADNFAVSNVNITSGAISVSKKSTSPSDTTIVKGSDNTVLLANVRADEAITVDGLVLQYDSNGFATTTGQFENVRVYVNGLLLDSFDPSASSTIALTATVDSAFTLNKGDNEVKVMVKAKTTATNGIFIAKLVGGTAAGEMFYGMNPEYVVSNNVVSGDIGGSATGGVFTVASASLTTVKNDGYSDNKTIVKGSTDVSLGKFIVKANNDKVTVSSIGFGANLGSTSPTSISDMKLYVDGVKVGNTLDFGTSGVTFSSLNFDIAKDSTKSIELLGSFDSSADGTFQSLMTVNARDSRGTAITAGSYQATTTLFAVSDAGSLNVAVGGDTPIAGLLATKAGVEQEVAQFKFTAVSDSANLTEIQVVNWDGSAATSSADSRIAAIKLYNGSELIDSFVPVDGAGKFTITNNKVVVAANGNKTLSIKVVLNNIDNDVNATNKPLTIKVTDVKSKSSAGAESTTNANKIASSFLIRKTIPTVAYLALGGTLLTAGDTTIARFSVSADANGDVEVGSLALTVATSANATIATSTTPLKVGTTNGMANKAGATASLSGTKMTITFAKEIVAAGTTKIFEVVADVSASAANQSVTARILEDASYDADSSASGVTGDFVWSDVSSVTTESWNSGHTVKGLPTTTWVLSN